MTFTLLSDDLLDRLERTGISRSARLLHVEALAYGNRLLTDGRIERRELRKLTDAGSAEEIEELVSAGLWVPLEDVDGWQIEWTDQELADDVRIRRDRAADRARRHRRHRNGDHELCDPKYCADARRITRDATRDATSDATRSHPIPSHPTPKEGGVRKGRGAGAGDQSATSPARCSHGTFNGRQIRGTGANASRVCDRCEEEDLRTQLALAAGAHDLAAPVRPARAADDVLEEVGRP